MQRVRRPAAVVTLIVTMTALGGCGEDIPTKDQFIEHMKGRTADRTLSMSVYGCTYDAIRKDSKLLETALADDMDEDEKKKLPKKQQEELEAMTAKLRTIFSKCVLSGSTTTTAPK